MVRSDITLLASGLVVFLYGMALASEGLRLAAGRRLRTGLAFVARNRFGAVLAGVALAVALNSSSAASAMLVALSGAGLVGAGETFGVLLGTGVGTSVTVQILSFDLDQYAFLIIAVGLVGRMTARREERKALANALLGVGLVFFGLGLMKHAVVGLRTSETALRLLASAPLAFFGSILFTAVIQGSAATILLAQGLLSADVISLRIGILVVLGANIGTCATAFLGAATAGGKGIRVALFNVFYKVVTALVLLPLLKPLASLSSWMTSGFTDRVLVNAHLLYNLFGLFLFLPFLGRASALLARLPFRRRQPPPHVLPLPADIERHPEQSLPAVLEVLNRMGQRTLDIFQRVPETLESENTQPIQAIESDADDVASVDEVLTTILGDVESANLDAEAHHVRDGFLAATDYLGRIATIIAREAMPLARRKLREDRHFSMESMSDLRRFHRLVAGSFVTALSILAGTPTASVDAVLAADKEAAAMHAQLLRVHRQRHRRGVLDAERAGIIYRDILTVLREVHSQLALMVEQLQKAPPAPRH